MNVPRNLPASDGDPRREQLSALYDGDATALEGGCAAWRDHAEARATWHAYHLIGDVLRSEDLASCASRDAAFLGALRTRLAGEPVIVAPTPASPRRQGWLLPAAAAAGFVAVAGVLVVVRMASPSEPASPTLAVGTPPAGSVTLVGAGAAAAAAPAVSGYGGPMIRDPQLDRYLQAHRGVLVGGAVAVPGGVPRNLEVSVPVSPAATPAAR